MTTRLRVFVSSVQKELQDERVIVQHLLSTDVFLSAHCEPVLYEYEPASPERATEGCIKALDGCQVSVLIVGAEYGTRVGDLSMTHAEYKHARRRKLPILAFIKGDHHVKREEGTEALLKELQADGLKYKRFGDVVDLQKEVRAALVKVLKEEFHLSPSSVEDEVAQQTIEATSKFESGLLTRLRWKDLDHEVLRRLIAGADARDAKSLSETDLLAGASLRGLVWFELTSGEHFATAAGIVLLAKDPSAVFPHCRILADAYRSTEPDGDPSDHEDIRAPMPVAVDRALAFVDRNTRHPMRIVGMNRVRLDEYPVEAMREALVNAVAHRQYEDAGRKILLQIFSNRVDVLSPGLPPAPLTLANLRRGKYRPCSRNPVLAQCLSSFHRIEERGSGFRRMHDQMLNHGLDAPVLRSDTGYFQVTFPGPADNVERIRVPEGRVLVTPAVEAQLNDRQKNILAHVLKAGSVTSGWCLTEFGVVYSTAYRDLDALVQLGVLKQKGKGRATRYTLQERLA